MTYKLIALDVDGTIRTLEQGPSERTRDAIARAVGEGAVVTLATGRMFSSARAASAELNISAPIISFQGAQVGDPVSGRVLWHRPLTEAMARAALDALEAWKGEIVAYVGDHVHVTELTPWAEGYSQRNPGRVRIVGDLAELAPHRPTRLLAVGEEGNVLRLDRRLKSEFDSRLHVTRSLPNFCEILHPESGKHRALAWLADYLGVRQAETVAFGNGYNDVDMLRWAGIGVAVEGAVPEAREAADRIAPPLEDDGVAQVIEELVDRGLVG